MASSQPPEHISHPVVAAFPLLPLTHSVTFGDWWLGPLDEYQGVWVTDAFKGSVRRFLTSFRLSDRSSIEKPSLLVRSDVADGKAPTDAEIEALALAVGFATIDANPYWTPENRHDGWQIATTDNADLWVQPLDIEAGWITLGRGGRSYTMAGGTRFTDPDFFIPTPLELQLPFSCNLDAEVLGATYEVLLADTSSRAASLRVAIRWLLKSWQNTPSITWEDRLVYLKIATEALTGTDNSIDSAKAVETIFVEARKQPGEGVGIEHLLWQASTKTITRTWTTKTGTTKHDQVSPFVHWYMEMADARNALVHGEALSTLTYHRDGSPYNGPMVDMADRIVREAILVLLGTCGYPAVWRKGITRGSFRAWETLTAANDAEDE